MIDADASEVACQVLAPPPQPASVYDFACGVILHDGPLAGSRLNPLAERPIELWLRTLESRKYRWHTLVAPSQRGKTLTGVVIPTLHTLIEERGNYGWIMPNLDKLGQKWEGTFKPMIEGGGFKAYMPDKGPASRGGRPAALGFRDPDTKRRLATLYAMALGRGGSETSTSSVPCSRLGIDEADDALNAGQIRLAQKRTASYGAAGGGIITGTVNDRQGRDLHPILEIYSEGTRTRLAHLCPHCNVHVVPNLENFIVDDAAIACPNCHVIWSESDRHQARNAAIYVHGQPDADEFSVLYTQLDYFWEYPDPRTGNVELLMVALAREHRMALAAKDRGDPSQWETYLRKSWCRAESVGDGEVPATIDLEQAARATKSPHTRGHIPAESSVITTGADIGKRDGWMLQLSMSADLSWHVVDWGHRETSDSKAEPTPVEQTDMLDALRERMGRIGRCDVIGVDVGYNTDLVVRWARANGIKLMRGDQRPTGKKDDAENEHLPSWADARKQDDGSTWIFIDGRAVKAEIAKALARPPRTPGAGHLPTGQDAGDWLIRHLTAEVWDAKHQTWVKRPGRANHLLDCLVYAWALAMISILRPPPAEQKIDLPIMHLGGLRL